MDFERDEAKDRANVAKHGVGFETAKHIFEGTILTRQDSRRDYGETRHTSVDRVGPAVLVVAHTRRGANLWLISARPASRKERKAYHEHTQKGP